LADTHINAYVRMKLAATEDLPTVKSYEEARWAELPEARTGEVDISLALLGALHRRWLAFLRALDPADFRRAFRHYEWGDVTIDECITMYSWHCRHHTAHIEIALRRRI
jgi:DinB superfamily